MFYRPPAKSAHSPSGPAHPARAPINHETLGGGGRTPSAATLQSAEHARRTSRINRNLAPLPVGTETHLHNAPMMLAGSTVPAAIASLNSQSVLILPVYMPTHVPLAPISAESTPQEAQAHFRSVPGIITCPMLRQSMLRVSEVATAPAQQA